MSLDAYAYVSNLMAAPNGEGITGKEKLVLYALAGCHNQHRRVAWPSHSLIAEQAHCAEKWVRHLLRELERKGVVGIVAPAKNGRGYTPRYWFCEIDPDPRGVPGGEIERGNSGPPFSAGERGRKGGTVSPENGHKGGSTRPRNKEESLIGLNHESKTTREAAPARSPDKRHAPLREAIQRVQRHFLPSAVWDRSADKKLAEMLDSVPDLRVEDLLVAVVWWALSPETVHGMHPRLWLAYLPAYQQGPLKNFKPYVSPADPGGWTTKRNFAELLAVAKGGDVVQQHLASQQEGAR